MDIKSTNRAFTLIELLVVVAIIGILASVVMASLNTARAKARDAKRLVELRQIVTATEIFYNDNNTYPSATTSFVYAVVGLTPKYIATLPEDPTRTRSDRYRYWYTDRTKGYTMLVQLETDAVPGWCKIVVGSLGYAGWNSVPNCK
ncbi:MAG TPA: type II secretion system protein [Candidatus Paceibacterota bacterium]